MIVMKFGGTSVESAAAIERVAGLSRPLARRPVVVVSAMGKTTNKLLAHRQCRHRRRAGRRTSGRFTNCATSTSEARRSMPLAERAELDSIVDEHFQDSRSSSRVSPYSAN